MKLWYGTTYGTQAGYSREDALSALACLRAPSESRLIKLCRIGS